MTCSVPKPQNGSNNNNGILDAVLVVGPDLTDILISHDLDTTFEPVVCHAYPRNVVFESIQHFCYPNGVQLVSNEGRRASINSSETDSDTEAGGDDEVMDADDHERYNLYTCLFSPGIY